MRSRFVVFVTVCCAAALAGCSLTPTMPVPEARQNLPESYAGPLPDSLLFALPDTTTSAADDRPTARDTAAYRALRWWTAFHDPTLNALIDSALVGNLNLKAARARLQRVAAQFRIARAPLFPSVQGSGSVTRQSQPANTGIGGAIGGGGQQFPSRFSFTTYTASLGLSYEIDFWGRIRSQRKAALSEFFATAADLQGARLAAISQMVSTYFQAVALDAQVRLVARDITLLRDRLALTRSRYARGQATAFAVYQLKQQLAAARAQQPDLHAQFHDARTRLALLAGAYAGWERALLRTTGGPLGPDTLRLGRVPAEVPLQLLGQRPDVMAAAARLEAARQRIGAARANLLPTVSLSSQVGLQSSSLEDLFSPGQWFSNLMASLTQPLFQGGALWAQVEVSRATYKQRLAAYEQTLLTAYQEVQAALVTYNRARERWRRVQAQVAAARNALGTQRLRYRRGIGTYFALLDAERALVQAQQRRATIQLALVQARLGVHRALGGAWTDAPPPSDPRLFH
ncbi:efflux transporter outer membrane subunit [Salisaeta longa]|uniref:efflux transporter outer membrane subunit n=1 Tax=Salisaeta longa TaxID=503170 RepID=UPI0003B733A7|nr:efflux transporter outer membrane subunit [Salisaeta longa]